MKCLPSHHYDGAVLIAPKAQDAYFRRYKEDHPEERFDVLDLEALSACFQYQLAPGYEKCLQMHGAGEAELDLAKVVIPRLRYAMKAKSLQRYFEYRDILEKEGYLRTSCDPFAFFKGRSIIVRGYYDGKGIAEALQDLPNICVNYDYGLDALNASFPEPLTIEEAMKRIGAAEAPVYAIAFGVEIPKEASHLPRLEGPYAPSEGSFIVFGDPFSAPVEVPDLPEEALKALRIPTMAEALRRKEVEAKYLLLSTRQLARVGA